MTVVSAMVFNPESKDGAIVSDEQQSGMGRKYDLAAKIRLLTTGTAFALVGGSGMSNILDESLRRAEEYIKIASKNTKRQITKSEEIVEVLARQMDEVKREYWNAFLYGMWGLREDEFQIGCKIDERGKVGPQIDKSLMERYHDMIGNRNSAFGDLSRNSFVALASDNASNNKRLTLYVAYASSPKHTLTENPYHAIGSGNDMADAVLGDFFELIPRNKREDINPIDGIIALIRATERAGARNLYVGGTPMIRVVKKGKALPEPSEESSMLAMEVVKAAARGYVSKEFQRQAIEALLHNGAPFSEIEQQMWGATTDKMALDRMLRGYKV